MNSRNNEPRALLYILQAGKLYGTDRMALATPRGMDEYDKPVVLASSPEKRRRMGERAVAKIRSHYSWKDKVDQMSRFYDAARCSSVSSEGKGAVYRR